MANIENIEPIDDELWQRYSGCLLAGAAGDALGSTVEFMSLENIQSHFGANGIRDFAKCYEHAGAITDDTQMTLFTAEGLLRAHVAKHTGGLFSSGGFASKVKEPLINYGFVIPTKEAV